MSGYIPADCVQFDGNYSPSSSQSQYVYATLTENKMTTRSGPSTKYYETGSYFGHGTSVKLYSRVYDSVNEIWWVQAEANENGRLRRVYTGSWRFANLNVNSLPEEYCITSGRMNGSCTLYGMVPETSMTPMTPPSAQALHSARTLMRTDGFRSSVR